MTERDETQLISKTEWEILDELDRGVLKWGAAVGAVWKNLARHGYVKRGFGPITEQGRLAVRRWRAAREDTP